MNYNILRRFGVITLLAIAAVFVQGVVLHYLFPSMVVPNFLTILVIFIGFYDVSSSGAFQAFLIGLISDLCSGILVGPSAGSYIFVYGILAALSTRIFVESALTTIVVVFVSSMASSLLYLALVYQFSPMVSRGFGEITLEAVMTSILAPLVFKMLKRMLVGKERVTSRGSGRTRTRLAIP